MPTLLDKNVIFNVAVGNVSVADALKELLASGETVYIARRAYQELVHDSPEQFRAGYEALLRDLKITTAPVKLSEIKGRGDFYADNINYDPKPNQLGRVTMYADKEETILDDGFIAAEARAMGAKLWTLDERTGKRAANLGVQLAPQCKLKSKGEKKDESIATARRLMGLNPVSPVGTTANPTRTTSEPSKTSSDHDAHDTKETTSQVGEPLQPVQEFGPNAAGDAKFQGAAEGLEILNWGLHLFNDAKQGHRFQDAYKSRWEPEVQRRLSADPQLGALISISYAKDKGDPESPIDTVTIFQDIEVGFGLDRDDALRDLLSHDSIRAGRADVGSTLWIKPRAPTDIRRLKLPFGCRIAGLATFVPGKEELIRVKFSGVAGFDDKWFSKREVEVPAGSSPRFYYLWPPDTIEYYRDGRWRTVDVGWEMSNEADASRVPRGTLLTQVPAVKLDSSLNPFNTTAAMVWPADNFTANLFQRAGAATQDNYGLLNNNDIGPMRWIKPECIRILKAPVD